MACETAWCCLSADKFCRHGDPSSCTDTQLPGGELVVTSAAQMLPPALAAQLHRGAYLAAEGAKVLAVLTDFNLLDLLPQTGTITSPVLANNAHLLGAL